MRFYISGPISGLTVEQYTENFGRAEAMLMNMDHEAVNPVKVVPCITEDCTGDRGTQVDGGFVHSYNCYMRHDIKAMMDCDAIVMIPGWERSKGANIELQLARALDFDTFFCPESYDRLEQLIESNEF